MAKKNDKNGGKKAESGGPIVGVDLGGTKILARMVDPETGEAHGRVKRSTPTDGVESVLDAVAEVVRELDDWDESPAIGVGIPGPARRDGIVAYCPNIVGWDEPVNVAKELKKRLDKKVYVSNDVNCGAVAEHRLGAGRGREALLVVFVGTGVGGGLILDDQLIVGERGQTGEIGHLTVTPGGRPCGCGGQGHLETYAGRLGMDREARRLAESGTPSLLVQQVGTGRIKSRHLAEALEQEDKVTVGLIQEAADALALVIGNVATMNDVPLCVLGGGIVDRLGERFLNQIRTSPSFGGLGPDFVELALAQRLDDAGVVGAALLAADRAF